LPEVGKCIFNTRRGIVRSARYYWVCHLSNKNDFFAFMYPIVEWVMMRKLGLVEQFGLLQDFPGIEMC